ncbi:MAG: PAS domain-containing protein [Pseudomonadota bacterium]
MNIALENLFPDHAQYELFAGAANDQDASGGLDPGRLNHRSWRLRCDSPPQQASYRSLIEQVPAITYVVLPTCHGGALAFVSPQISALGYSAAQWLDNPALHGMCIHPDDRDHALAALAASRCSGAPLHIEYRLIARNGAIRWYRDQAQPICNAFGTWTHMQGMLVDISHYKAAEQALAHTQDQLRALAARQDSVKEDERTRIARELHDELGGLLTGVKACIVIASRQNAGAADSGEPILCAALELIDNAIATVSKVATDLRPSILEHLGIWPALEWQARHVARLGDLHCEWRMDPALNDMTLGRECESMLFRVLQEALTNVVRHAQARRLEVSIARHEGVLRLSVRDDGIGIPAGRSAGSGSWGILGMQERAGHFCGKVSFTSAPGQGTTVVLSLPTGHRHAS